MVVREIEAVPMAMERLMNSDVGDRDFLDRIGNQHLADGIIDVGKDVGWLAVAYRT